MSEAIFMCGILLLIAECGNARSGLNVNRWGAVLRKTSVGFEITISPLLLLLFTGILFHNIGSEMKIALLLFLFTPWVCPHSPNIILINMDDMG